MTIALGCAGQQGPRGQQCAKFPEGPQFKRQQPGIRWNVVQDGTALSLLFCGRSFVEAGWAPSLPWLGIMDVLVWVLFETVSVRLPLSTERGFSKSTVFIAFVTAIFRVFAEVAEPDCVFAVFRAPGVVPAATGAVLASSVWACYES